MGDEYGLSDFGSGFFQRMFWPVLIDQAVGRFFSEHKPCPLEPRNCGQSSARTTAVNTKITPASTIDLTRMILIIYQRPDVGLNPMLSRTEITCWKWGEPP